MAKKGSTRGSRFLVILIIASFLILGLHPQKNSFDVCYRIWQKKEKKLSLIPNGTHTSFLPPPHTVLMSRMSTCIYSYTYIHRHRAVPCQNLLSFSQNIFFCFQMPDRKSTNPSCLLPKYWHFYPGGKCLVWFAINLLQSYVVHMR